MQTAMHALAEPLIAQARGRCGRITAIAIAIAAAVQGASAGSFGRDSPLGLKVAPAEAIAPAAIVSEVPFQQYVLLTCSDVPVQCMGSIPAVPPKERLVIQFVSCNAVTPPGAPGLSSFVMVVTNPRTTKLFGAHFVAPAYASGQYFIASQPMLLTVEANRVLRLVANGLKLSFAECGVSGVRQKLG